MSPSLLNVGPIFDSLFLGGLDEKEKIVYRRSALNPKSFNPQSRVHFSFHKSTVPIFCQVISVENVSNLFFRKNLFRCRFFNCNFVSLVDEWKMVDCA